MGYDPNEPRDGRGRWTRGGGSYGPGQKLKGKYNEPNRRIVDANAKTIQSTTDREDAISVIKPWSKMNSTQRATLEASARFETNFKQGSRKSRGIATGAKPKNLHEKTVMTPDGPRSIYAPSRHAIAIQTAKSLDRDFRVARDKSNQEAMKAALAKSNVPIVKYPSKKPKK